MFGRAPREALGPVRDPREIYYRKSYIIDSGRGTSWAPEWRQSDRGTARGPATEPGVKTE